LEVPIQKSIAFVVDTSESWREAELTSKLGPISTDGSHPAPADRTIYYM